MNKYIQKINIHSQNKEDNYMSNSNIEDKTLSNFDLEGFANMHSMPKDANSEKLNEAIRQNVASHTQTIETDCDLYKRGERHRRHHRLSSHRHHERLPELAQPRFLPS